MSLHIAMGEDTREALAQWALAQIRDMPGWGEWYQAIGLMRGDEPQAVVVYNHYSGCDIAMHIAAVPGRRWMTREFLRAVFRYPFVQLNCRRVTGYVPAKNRDALRFDTHIGFREEGRMRHALPDDDVLVLGLLREDCRYLGDTP